jgi:quinolinate synthase
MNFKAEIEKLKKAKNAIILAHYYVSEEIQEIADVIGDSLALAEASIKVQSNIIVFCGVHFMAETAKILNPKAKVLLPDLNAGCSLADATPIDQFISFKKQHPKAVVVSYINCSAAVKSESDYICTSSNAVNVVNAIPREKEIIFAPDKHLGNYVEKMTNRKMHLWNGSCIVHLNISLEKLKMLMQEHPDAILIAHPECDISILDMAKFIGSTKNLIDHVKLSAEKKFIVATEAGILYKMKKEAPEKIIIPAPSFETNTCACSECPYMKLNTLEKVYHTLNNEFPYIEVEYEISKKALKALDNMLSIAK